MNWASMSDRDKRALRLLGVALGLAAIYFLWTAAPSATGSSAAAGTDPADPMAEKIALKRLENTRRNAATTPSGAEVLKRLEGELKRREAGLIDAPTAPQAVAQLIQAAQRVARSQPQPMAIFPIETGRVQALGDAYGEAVVTMASTCQIEQLVNFLAGLSAQKELITTTSVQISQGALNEKTINVRVGLAAVVPKRLAPKKGAS